MSLLTYSFASLASSCLGTSPLTITFNPSALGFVSKLIYGFPDKTITRVYTFATSAEALTTYKDIDVRAPLTYTFSGLNVASNNSTTYVVSITALSGATLTPVIFTLSANIVLQYLTKNPTGSSAPYAFEDINLIKTRVWGASNSQLYILETKTPSYLLVSTGSQGSVFIPAPVEYLVTETEDAIVTEEDIPIEVV